MTGQTFHLLETQDSIYSQESWVESGRQAVLTALDEFVHKKTGSQAVLGAQDRDLTLLFQALDAHLLQLADRINEGSFGCKITK